MYMTNKTTDLTNPTLEKINFGWKEFDVKRLNINAVLKIASIIGSLDSSVQIIDTKNDKINLWALANIDWDDINELISMILRTSIKEVDSLFNMTDFIRLVKVVLKQEDIQWLFLEISQLTEALQPQVEKQ